MSSELIEDYIVLLRELKDRISELIADGRKQGVLLPSKETYVRDRVLNFQETGQGPVVKTWEPEYIEKDSWRNAATVVAWRVKGLGAYELARESLAKSNHLSEDQVSQLLEALTYRLALVHLEEKDQSRRLEHFEASLSLVSAHFKGETLKYSGEVRLTGLTPPASGIELSISGIEFRLRRRTLEDLENEEYYTGYRESLSDDPSAILSIHFLSTPSDGGHKLQQTVTRAIDVLRLFKVGSVKYLSFRQQSDSLVGRFSAVISSGNHHVEYEQYPIEESEIPRLASLWRELSNVLPAEGFGHSSTEVDAIGIAYQRYSDALLMFGSVERRIAESVMGLESLFLRGSENQELVYRLRMRVAKVLGLLGADPHLEKRVANDAYTIRSAFVHGDIVKPDDKRSIEKRHGDLSALLRSVLNQLRIAISLFLLSRIDKEELISLIDSSFIDQHKLPELERILEPVGALLSFPAKG